MTDAQRLVAAKLLDYTPGDATAELTFAGRLAREHDWAPAFAARVIREYLRFALLAVTSDEPMTPSVAVDEAWHLHLTYTIDYWERFCPHVLGARLHHNPTKGGRAQGRTFDEQYRNTLRTYEAVFGEAPPSDIWPEAEIRFDPARRPVLATRHTHWIIKKPRLNLRRAAAALGVVAALVGFGCAPLTVGGDWNPLNWNGKEFIDFYMIFGVALAVVCFAVRRAMRKTTLQPGPDLDRYELAVLAYGPRMPFHAALVQLIADKRIPADPGTWPAWSASGTHEPMPADAPPIERDVEEAIRKHGTMDAVMTAALPHGQAAAEKLEQRGFFLSKEQASKSVSIPLMLWISMLLFAAAKVIVGLESGKPVGFLILLIIGVIVVAVVLASVRGRCSRGGLAYLAKRRQDAKAKPAEPNFDPATAVALGGLSALAGHELYRPYVAQRFPAGDGSDGGASSFSYGGGDTGGSGGGDGGGDGGGGCGGCGGGD